MRVLALPSDTGGCGWYRILEPARVLRRLGLDVTVMDHAAQPFMCVWDRDPDSDPDARIVGLAERPDADVVVLQRPTRRVHPDLVVALQRAGIAVVVEIDDNFSAIPVDNIAHPRFDPSRGGDNAHTYLAVCAQLADLVTVSTPALAGVYGRHGRVAVLPNLVPSRYADIVPDDMPDDAPAVRVGWSGSLAVHASDPAVMRGALGQVLAEFPEAGYCHVGDPRGVARAFRIPPAFHSTGWIGDIELYMRRMAALDVGVVPLARNRFNDSKSWLKGLEFSAVGVPFVASPRPEYLRLHRAGAGLIASTRADWVRHLRTLIGSKTAREELGEAGREVAARLTYDSHAELWWAAYTEARVNRYRAREAV